MSNLPKLKKKAAELEQKKQYDKALQVYSQILEEIAGSEQDEDVALYNRVGDILLRQGDVGQAVDYYEKAVDLYAEGGFFNNAIALCNKILRNAPGRNSIYYKLGKISAKKGFTSDAKQNFLEYADRMQKGGKTDEAFRALKEFADLCPDQDDIRLMLAEQLSKRERKGEALEQLQTLYEKFQAEGRSAEARATVDRMKSIDPAVEPKEGGAASKQKAGDLVFLDVDYGDASAARKGSKTPSASPAPSRPEKRRRDLPPTPPDPMGGLPLIDTRDTPEAAPAAAAEASPVFDPPIIGGPLDGLQSTSLDAAASEDAGGLGSGTAGDIGGGMLEMEPTSLGGELEGFTLGAPIEQESIAPEHDLALPGELPMLDMPSFGVDQFGGMSFDSSLDSGGSFGGDLGNGTGEDVSLLLDDDSVRDFGGDVSPLADLDAPLGGAETSSEFPALDAGSDLDIQKEDSASLGAGFDDLDGGDLPMLDVGGEPLSGTPAGGRRAVAAERGATSAHPAAASAATGVASPSREQVAQMLRDQVAADESNWELRRRYAEALLECGEREGGLEELEHAMIGFERAHDIDAAASVADEIIRLNPNSVRHHQKRVEYAFRASDKKRLSESYLELADALFRSGQADKAKTVYQRVLELSPDDVRAQAALSTFVDAAAPEPAKPAPRPPDRGDRSGVYRRYTAAPKKESKSDLPPIPVAPPPTASDDDFVNLGDWLKDETPAKSTRMVVEEKPPTGDEQADFADMLKRFKQGIAENVEEEDHESHYDLGVAYKEMGLLDEAIAEFQKALRGASHRVRSYEALGQCFLEKSQFQVAATILARALQEPGAGDDKLVGVLYLLGYATEALHHYGEALGFYRRVFAVDIQFRDVSDRIAAIERRPK
ncbi:MAG TPA: tetratricopeptide repeat protein [Gemmatimonadaceae bacterium]